MDGNGNGSVNVDVVVITSRGTLDDGRSFQFNVNHHSDTTRSILLDTLRPS